MEQIYQSQGKRREEEKLLFKHGNRAASHWSLIFWCFTWGEQNPLQTSQELDLY